MGWLNMKKWRAILGIGAFAILTFGVHSAWPLISIQYHYVQHNWRSADIDRGEFAAQAMVVSAHPLASQIGSDVMAKGGNAFDAAVAVNFALAVVYPQAGNIGGGGFLVFREPDGNAGTLDFRETAPIRAHADMYLDDYGEVIKGLSVAGPLSVGVPGTVAGMVAMHNRLGKLPWGDLLAPAIELAESGFALSEKGANMLNRYREDFINLNRYDVAYLRVPSDVPRSDAPRGDGDPAQWRKGDFLRLTELAQTLQQIKSFGRDGFYKGRVADLLVQEMQAQGGLISQADLDAYEAKWRDPIELIYRGYKVITMPPPSSGGVALSQLLQGASAYDLSTLGHNSPDYIHILTELERRVYADRAVYLGDPDFYEVPVRQLTAADYIAERMADISLQQKTNSQDILPGFVNAIESVETTHISIVDPDGNAVAITTTLNGNFGSKVVVSGAGFLLNNEMDDFSIKAGHANQYGLVGEAANAIAPQKRMLSSMTPTIVEKDRELFLVLGTPGGATIITSVFQALLNIIDFDMTAQQAVNARKFHHQWQPDKILFEKGTPDAFDVLNLTKRGHELIMWPDFKFELGRLEIIKHNLGASSDRRYEGAADRTRGKDDRAIGF